MAHELAKNTKTGGRAMAWVRGEGTPWHGLGTAVERAMTSAEAIQAAGQDYEVLKVQLHAPLPEGPPVAIPDKYATVRADTGDVLGLVSGQYKVVQNAAAYEFLDGLVGDGLMRFHTAGAIRGGKQVWMLGKLPETVKVTGQDVVDKYLLFTNGHDGSSAVRCFFTPIRVVCANTLTAALMGAEGSRDGVWTFRHVGDMKAKLEEARRVLGLAEQWFSRFGEGAASLTGYAVSQAVLRAYVQAVYPDPTGLNGKPASDAERAKASAHRARIMELFETGVGLDMPGVRGTAWAAYNAVAEHFEHDRSDRKGSRDRRTPAQLAWNWFGGGRAVRQKAWTLAQGLASGQWTPDTSVSVAMPHGTSTAVLEAPAGVAVADAEPEAEARELEVVLDDVAPDLGEQVAKAGKAGAQRTMASRAAKGKAKAPKGGPSAN